MSRDKKYEQTREPKGGKNNQCNRMNAYDLD